LIAETPRRLLHDQDLSKGSRTLTEKINQDNDSIS